MLLTGMMATVRGAATALDVPEFEIEALVQEGKLRTQLIGGKPHVDLVLAQSLIREGNRADGPKSGVASDR